MQQSASIHGRHMENTARIGGDALRDSARIGADAVNSATRSIDRNTNRLCDSVDAGTVELSRGVISAAERLAEQGEKTTSDVLAEVRALQFRAAEYGKAADRSAEKHIGAFQRNGHELANHME